jgi:hypothetical protein
MKKIAVVTLLLLGLGCPSWAEVVFSSTTVADAFLATGSPDNPAGADLTALNYGGAGTLVVAPASSAKGEFQSVIRFRLAEAVTLFNGAYGSNNWSITGISLELTSNYGTNGVQPNNPIFPAISGGKFVIEWLADDSWVEGTGNPSRPTTDGVTYNDLASLLALPHESLCTNTYAPPGNNVHVTWPLPLSSNVVADITAGGEVSFLFYAGDQQVGYLFNSYFYGRGNEPLIHVTAAASLKILSGAYTNGCFRLAGRGTPDTEYAVEAVTGVGTGSWQKVGTAISDGAGSIQFVDTNAAAYPQRYYRLRR